ncbi:hypothetical protein RB213_011099, partial [Colletotrichum asianum]
MYPSAYPILDTSRRLPCIQPYRNSRYSSGRTPSSQGETIASLRLGSLHLNFMSAHFNLPPAPKIEESGRPIWINSQELRQQARKPQAVTNGRVLIWLSLNPVSIHRALKSMHRTHHDMSRTSVCLVLSDWYTVYPRLGSENPAFRSSI